MKSGYGGSIHSSKGFEVAWKAVDVKGFIHCNGNSQEVIFIAKR